MAALDILALSKLSDEYQFAEWEFVQVPFAIVALLDHVRQKKLPPELKCRQVPDPYRACLGLS